MTDECSHLPEDLAAPTIGEGVDGCEVCIAAGKRNWVHLRVCQSCGTVGCCDNSPGKHATAHNAATSHPLIRSFEPREDWWYCYVDADLFMVDGAPTAPSY